MKRLALIAAATTAAASIIVLNGATPVIARSSTNGLQLTSKTLLVTAATTTPAPGDHIEFYERDTGGDNGNDYFDCVVTNPHGGTICNAEFVLKHGNISIEGVFNANSAIANTTAIITGGTGRYNAAHGTAIVTGPTTNTHFAFHFAG